MGRGVPRPVQHCGFDGAGPPLIVGGTGDRILRIAAEHADIIAVAGVYQIKGQPPGTFRLGTAEEAAERVRYARECAGERADAVEWHVLVQMVVETDDRRAVAEKIVEQHGRTMTVDELLDTPFVLIGTVEQMAERILRDRERFGFTYYTVHGPFMEAFAPVIERVRELTADRS
jgi:probable F420-dependent oxidoreductase